jgi:hypothetical protein
MAKRTRMFLKLIIICMLIFFILCSAMRLKLRAPHAILDCIFQALDIHYLMKNCSSGVIILQPEILEEKQKSLNESKRKNLHFQSVFLKKFEKNVLKGRLFIGAIVARHRAWPNKLPNILLVNKGKHLYDFPYPVLKIVISSVGNFFLHLSNAFRYILEVSF